MKKIWIAILNQGWMRPELCNLLLNMINYKNKYLMQIRYPNHTPIVNNRNIIAKQFLESNFDYLLMIDSDTVPQNNPLNLVELDKDIISCPTLQWNERTVYWVVMKQVFGGYKPIPRPKYCRDPQEVDAVGTGCILIARRVLIAMEFPFQRKWTKEGIQELGQDFYFCARAKALGFKVWADWDCVCKHHKLLELTEILNFNY